MVAIVSGNSLGVSLTSLATLGQGGTLGSATQGSTGENVYVNVSNGNLVVQDLDDQLVVAGEDVVALRTYNSQGLNDDDNQDDWTNGYMKTNGSLVVTTDIYGTVTITRTAADGARGLYTSTGTNSYKCTGGAGAYDTITSASDSSGTFYTCKDGASGATEEYRRIGSGKYALVAATDAAGNKTVFGYDSNGYLTSVKAATGETFTYNYTTISSTAKQLRSITATASDGTTLAKRVTYEYEGSTAISALKSVVVDLTPDNLGDSVTYRTSYTYNINRQLETISQDDGTRLTFTYNSSSKVASVTDALGNKTSFSYFTGQTTLTDALGKVTTYDYDSSGQLTKVTAPSINGVSQITSYTWDATTGDLKSLADPMGRTLSMSYDSRGNQTQQRDSEGNTVTRTFDARNQVLTEAIYLGPDPDGSGYQAPSDPRVTRYVYDSGNKNLLRYVISAEGRVTEHRYDARGQRESTLQYSGASYAVSGLTTTQALTVAQMDTWAIASVGLGVQRTDFKYEIAPNLRSQLTTQTVWAKTGADGAGQSDGNEAKTVHVYDYAGRLIKSIAGAGRADAQITAYAYDGLGRVTVVTDALNQVTINEYTATTTNSSTIKVRAANGLVTTSVYDNAGRLTSVARSGPTGTALGTTIYSYDALGRLALTTGPVGVRTWIIYDSAGRKVGDVDGDGSLTEYVYNKDNQVTRTIEYATAVSAASLVYSVTSGAPTLSSIRPLAAAGDRSTWRIYDDAGRLVKTIDADGQVAQSFYDGASRVVMTTRYATAASTAYLGNAPADFVADTHADDRTERNFYDGDGLLLATLDGEGYLTELSYTGAGQLYKRQQYAGVTSVSVRGGSLDQLRTSAQSVANSAAQSRVTWLLHDVKGQAPAEVDAEGYLTERVYDSLGRLVKTTRYTDRLTAAALGKLSATCLLADIRPSAAGAEQTTYEYDSLNRLSRETDFQGTVTQYTYDVAGNLTSTVRALGTTEARTLNSRYDVLGRLVGELTAEGAAQLVLGLTATRVYEIWTQWGLTHTYDAAGRRTSTADQNGNKTLFFYNADGQLTHTVNALGEVTETQYNALGQQAATVRYGTRISLTGLTGANAGGLVNTALTNALASVKNGSLDSVVSYTYTTAGRLKKTIDEAGFAVNYVYNAFGERMHRSRQISAWIVTDTILYDHRGLATKSTSDVGGFNADFKQKYDAFGRVIETTDASNNLRSYQYDRLGRVVQTTDALGKQRKTTYDAFDRVFSQEDELGAVTAYSYGAASRSMSVTSPEGVMVKTSFTRFGQTLSVSDELNNTTTYDYDRNGQLTKTTGADGTTVKNSYDRASRLFETEDANQHKVAFSYDAANRVVKRTVDPSTGTYVGLNLETRYEYDAKGQQITISEPGTSATTKLLYDLKGNLVERRVDNTGPDLVVKSLSTKYTYDAQSNVLKVTSPAGVVTQYTYDKLGRRIKEQIDPAGQNLTRTWSYSLAGALTSSTDASTNLTRYVNDAEGRVLISVDPMGQVTEYGYDAAGRVVKSTRYANALSVTGLPATLTAAQARPVADAQRDAVEHRVYDKDGHLLCVGTALGDNKFGVVRYKYDNLGRVNEQVAYANAVTGWTAGAVPAPVADSSDSRLRTLYDKLGRAIYTVDAVGAVVATKYDGQGNVVSRVAYAQPIDPAITESALPAAVAAQADAARDSSVRQVFDLAGRLAWSVDGTGSVTRRFYDASGNVVKLIGYAKRIAAGADPEGVPPDAGDRITQYAYDRAGRMIYSVDASLAVVRYTYDNDGRVTQRRAYAKPLTSAPVMTIADLQRTVATDDVNDREQRFAYDGAGRQVFTIDAAGAVQENGYDAAGHIVKSTTYATALSAAQLANLNATVTNIRNLLTKVSDDRVTLAANDAAGHQVFSIDATGAVRETVYDATGRAVRTIAHAKALSAANFSSLSGTAGGPTVSAIRVLLNPTDPDNRTTSVAYDAADRERYRVDATGHVTGSQYNALGRTTRTISYARAIALTTPNTLDSIAQAISADAAQDRVERSEYDGAGRLVRSTDALGASESYGYDALGNKTSFTNKAQATWTYSYDAAGRLLSETTPIVAVTTLDSAGSGSTTADSRMVTLNEYNAFGDLTSRTEGSRASAQDPLANSRKTEYRYDALGRQTQAILPSVQAYDANGVGSTVTPTVVVSYDAFGNAVVNKDVGGKYSAKVYDKAGRVRWDIDAAGYVTGYVRDSFGAVTQLTRYAVAMSGQLTATGATDSAVQSFLQAVDHSADRTLTTQHDALGRSVKVVEPLGYVFDQHTLGAQYLTAGRATETTFNALGDVLRTSVYAQDNQGARVTVSADTYFKYDLLGRKTAQIAVFERAALASTAQAYLTTTAYDGAGNLASQTEYAKAVTLADNSWTASAGIGYTPPAASSQDRTITYGYDLAGRKTTETRVNLIYGEAAGARLAGDAITRFGYDAVGNATSTTDALGTTTYTYYDALGRVTAVATPSLQAMRTRISQLYVLMFNRAPEEDGLNYWLQRLQSGRSLNGVASEMFAIGQAAGQFTGGAINTIYQRALGRDPDAAGFAFWNAQLDAAYALQATEPDGVGRVFVAMIDSVQAYDGQDPAALTSQRDFNTKVAAGVTYAVEQGGNDPIAAGQVTANAVRMATAARQVAQIYVTILGRAPEAAALAGYVAALTGPTDTKSFAQVAQAVFDSEEARNFYLGTMDDAQVVARLYQNVYGQAPSDAELQTWLAQKFGQPAGEFIQKLITSVTGEGAAGTEVTASALSARPAFNSKVAAALPRQLDAVLSLSPLTEFKLDVYGNVVKRIEYAGGAQSATAQGYVAAAASPFEDRISYTAYDSSGHALRNIDALQQSSYSFYDVSGRLARQEQQVTSDGVLQTAREVFSYDALGQVIQVKDPLGSQETVYNAFGEVTARGAGEKAAHEHYDYDNAGHLWRTNAGDGVEKVALYDIAGRQTADIRSAVNDLRATKYATAASVVPAGDLVRTDTRYDLLGHAIGQTRPTQYADEIGSVNGSVVSASRIVTVTQATLSADVLAWASPDNSGYMAWRGTNTVDLKWTSLAGLGSGDVRVVLTYRDADERESSHMQDFGADEVMQGVLMSWDNEAPVQSIARVQVLKKDVNGNWALIVDRTGDGDYGYQLRIHAPAHDEASVTLHYRTAGSTTWIGVPQAALLRFGDALLFDTSAIPEGNYEYEVRKQELTDTEPKSWDHGSLGIVSPAARRAIAQLYVSLLNRAPDVGGLAKYVAQYQSGTPLASIAQQLYGMVDPGTTPLYAGLSDTNFVKKFYTMVLGRADDDIDISGINFWAAQLNGDESKRGDLIVRMVAATTAYRDAGRANTIATDSQQRFNNKVEVALRFAQELGGFDLSQARAVLVPVTKDHATVQAGYDVVATTVLGKQIAELYVLLYNRAPEPGGLAFWVNRLATGSSPAVVAQDIFNSGVQLGVYAPTSTNAEIITRIYTNALGRAPDAVGLSFWSDRMAAPGVSKGQVFTELIAAVNRYIGTDDAALMSQRLFRNKVAVSVAFEAQSHVITDPAVQLATATALLAGITAASDPMDSINAKLAAALQAEQQSKANLATAVAQQGPTSADVTALAPGVPTQAAISTEVAELYTLLFNRAPELSGFNFWRGKLAQGSSFAEVAQGMYAAGQTLGVFPKPDAGKEAQVITQIYVNALGRGPDAAGLSYWSGQLATAIASADPNARGAVFVSLINAVQSYGGTDAAALKSKRLFDNKVAIGLAYVSMGGDSQATAANLVKLVTEFDIGAAAAQLQSLMDAPRLAAEAAAVAAGTTAASNSAATALAASNAEADARTAALSSVAAAAAAKATPTGDMRSEIARLYLALYQRAPTLTELNNWVSQRQSNGAEWVANQIITQVAFGSLTASDFVTRIYVNALGRQPDAGGLSYWVGQLSSSSRGAVALGILNTTAAYNGTDRLALGSQEFLDKAVANYLPPLVAAALASQTTATANVQSTLATKNTATTAYNSPYKTNLCQLYAALLGKSPNVAGLTGFNNWSSQLSGGTALVTVTNSMLTTEPDAVAYYGGTSDTDFIKQLYRRVCNREADAGGLAYWVGRFPASTRAQVVQDFIYGVYYYTGTDPLGLTSQSYFVGNVTTGINSITSAKTAADSAYTAAVTASNAANSAYTDTTAASNAATAAATTASKWVISCDATAAAASAAATATVTATADIRLELVRLFAAIYQRAPSLTELNTWTTARTQGQTADKVATQLLATSEAQAANRYPTTLTNQQFAAQLFRVALLREPDTDGLTFWTGQLNSGVSRGQVVVNFNAAVVGWRGSDATAIQGQRNFMTNVANYLAPQATTANSLNATAQAAATAAGAIGIGTSATAGTGSGFSQYVSQASQLTMYQLYTVIMRREPTIAEATSLAAQLQSGKSVATAAQELLDSAAGRILYPQGQSNSDFIKTFYTVALGRTADAGGLAYWTGQLAGNTRGRVIELILGNVAGYVGNNAAALTSQAFFNMNSYAADVTTWTAANTARDLANAEAARTKSIHDSAFDLWDSLRGIAAMNVSAGLQAGGQSGAGSLTQSGVTPNIDETVDRWGNLLSVTDARNAGWITRFSYNANNQLLDTIRADRNALTSNYYDQLGRQIAERDANGNVNRQRFDERGDLIEELHADGGIVQYQVDVFGQRTLARQADGEITGYAYDRLGQLVSRTQAAGFGVDVYASHDVGTSAAGTLSTGPQQLIESYVYDALGRRVMTRNAAGEITTQSYDLRGDVVKQTDAAGRVTSYGWDAFGHKNAEIRADGKTMGWALDQWGRVLSHVDFAGVDNGWNGYAYNRLGQITAQTSGHLQDLVYTYDNASGLLVKIEDKSEASAGTKVTQYAYDAAGNRTREKTSLQKAAADNTVTELDVAQDNHLGYDELGRLATINDARYSVSYQYDANGNRLNVHTEYLTETKADDGRSGTTEVKVDNWNKYDAMNRQTVVDGIKDATGNIVISAADGKGQQIAYDNAGNRILARQWGKQLVANTRENTSGRLDDSGQMPAYFTTWGTQDGWVTESYAYDAAGRVTDTYRDGVDIDARRYDAAGRVVQGGFTPGHSNVNYALRDAGVATDLQISEYVNGELHKQSVRGFNGSESNFNYDAAGRMSSYTVHVGGHLNTYTYGYEEADASRVQSIEVRRDDDKVGLTTNQYDANGYLVHVEGSENNAANERDLINDAAGRVLRRTQGGHVTHTLIANDEVIGSSSDAEAKVNTFLSSYVPINDRSLTAGPSAYTVQTGDTLQSIAKAVWGNPDLWYRIADANGITSVSAGQVITIPGKPNTIYSDINTFKPYDASAMVGDTTPTLPAPKAKVNWAKQFVAVFIQAIATAFLGPVLGNAAGQLVRMEMGLQDRFSWKSVALSAISEGITEGMDKLLPSDSWLAGKDWAPVAARAAIANAATQGIGVAVGLQPKFDWRGVAASAAGAGVGQAVAKGVLDTPFAQTFGTIGVRAVSGLAAGATVAVMRGGKVSVLQVASDAFGNALGSSIAEYSNSTQATQGPQLGQLGSGTFAVPGRDDVSTTTFCGGGRVTPEALMRLNDDKHVVKEWDEHDQQPAADDMDILQSAMRSGVPVAGRGLGYRAPWTPTAGAGRGFVNPAGFGGEAGQAFLDNVNEVLRETRSMGPTRASMYRDLAVSGKFGEMDWASQRSVLAAMVGYADSINQNLIGSGLNERTADAAVRYAADAAKESGAIPETFRFASDARVGALAGISVLNMPIRQRYEVPNAPVAGETEATVLGKAYHSQRAAERRASGDYDMVNEPFVGANGQPIMVTKRVDLRTGEPVPESGTQVARPDSVVFRRETVIDDKPFGRPLGKDQQEILRFIRAYEVQFGAPPRTIAIERYDPITMRPVVTELYKPSDFPLKKK